MKLSTHNQLAMLYRAFYNKEQLPKDLCSYFWLTLVAIICTSKSISLTNSSSFNFNDDERFNITLADEKDRQYFEACFKHNRIIPDYINFKIKEQYEIY